jgi:hypothetical protein
VILAAATGIPEEVVPLINLDCLDAAEVDVEGRWADPETLAASQAGEVLLRLP